MAAYTAAYSDVRINDNARFRTQGQWISDQLTTIGWTKTADTGQIDWTTVTAPGAADTKMGYEIRTSGEGLYLRIDYGSGYAAYAKALWFEFGAGSNGSGTITEPFWTAIQLRTANGYSGGAARAGDDYVSGAADRFMVALTDDTNDAYGGACILQKTLDENGDADGEGWDFIRCHHQNVGYHNFIGRALGGSATQFGLVRWPRAIGDASNIPVSPVTVGHPVRNLAQIRDCYVAPSSLVAHQSTITIDGLTYLSAYGGTTNSGVWGFTSPSNNAFLVRYD